MLKSNFIIRASGVMEGYFYIDFEGEYHPDRIHLITDVPIEKIVEIYKNHGGVYNEKYDVYYFETRAAAEDVIELMAKKIKPAKNVRQVELTEQEIEYIRKALINEDSNLIFTKGKIRDSIFEKLNR